jgi:hypothetical protein
MRDGASPFQDEPDDIASGIEGSVLPNIANGLPGLTGGMLPYIEEEAIARLRHNGLTISNDESALKRENWEHWRRLWTQEAHYFLQNATCGPIDASKNYAAAEALVAASRLRYAIEDGHAEKAAALGMLLVSWVHIGGLSIRFFVADTAATKHKKAQRTKAQKDRPNIALDDRRIRKSDVVEAAFKSAGIEAGTSDVWGHLISELESLGLAPHEGGAKTTRYIRATDANGNGVEFTFKGVQTMIRELKNAGRHQPSKLGRPTKKPA